jgi:hypothetical protein
VICSGYCFHYLTSVYRCWQELETNIFKTQRSIFHMVFTSVKFSSDVYHP